jgi:hypothetical protein
MRPDYKALCAGLATELESWEKADDQFSESGTIRADANYGLAPRARAALAQPEPMPPTDEDLLSMRSWSCHGPTFDSDLVDFGRRCYNLGRWGTPANAAAAELDVQ